MCERCKEQGCVGACYTDEQLMEVMGFDAEDITVIKSAEAQKGGD